MDLEKQKQNLNSKVKTFKTKLKTQAIKSGISGTAQELKGRAQMGIAKNIKKIDADKMMTTGLKNTVIGRTKSLPLRSALAKRKTKMSPGIENVQ